jgi:hypothetical protein
MMERILARALVSAGLMVVAALLGLAAVGFFLTAVYLAVLPLGQPWLAPASTSGVALLIALALAALIATSRHERRPAPRSSRIWRESAPRQHMARNPAQGFERLPLPRHRSLTYFP